eukprot:NODE_27328_length_517_cov_3.012821.p4 GENE.NODE_27328_length_517_cov_3.012821~~NODE_27328_length_517_cov_3.012821.p4  ORF type:complete len:75 (-),score=9.66 NODE_27328_length_517_cov_3.012821:206-430(-)
MRELLWGIPVFRWRYSCPSPHHAAAKRNLATGLLPPRRNAAAAPTSHRQRSHTRDLSVAPAALAAGCSSAVDLP